MIKRAQEVFPELWGHILHRNMFQCDVMTFSPVGICRKPSVIFYKFNNYPNLINKLYFGRCAKHKDQTEILRKKRILKVRIATKEEAMVAEIMES